MTKDEILTRFCGLSELVMDRRFNCREAADCFCGLKKSDPNNFQFSEGVMRYIECAVEDRLHEDAQKNR